MVNLGELYRCEYGRILASLIRVVGDFATAEDALHDAFQAALVQWPVQGVPPNPVAWLMSTARNKAIDQVRRRSLAEHKHHEMVAMAGSGEDVPAPIDSLRLIFTCCHPSLAPEAQVALTLRTICGLGTEEIAHAFLVPVPTMAQRLVRAKAKIKLAGIPYEVPADEELAERLQTVLAVIYLVFNEGYSASTGNEMLRVDLCTEAIRLGKEIVALLPSEREPKGLLALMLLTHARRAARTDAQGALVLLEDQDRSLWDRGEIEEGCGLANEALQRGPAGSYTLQAGIAVQHASVASMRETDWARIAVLYGMLAQLHPSPVIELNRAVAIAMADGFEKGLALIEQINLPEYHFVPAARADLLRRMRRFDEAAQFYREALRLVRNNAERRFLERRLAEVSALGL